MLMSRGVEYTAGLAAETEANAEQRRRCRTEIDTCMTSGTGLRALTTKPPNAHLVQAHARRRAFASTETWPRAARSHGARSQACPSSRTKPVLRRASSAPGPHPRGRPASQRTTRATPAERCAPGSCRRGGWRPCDAPRSATTRGRTRQRCPRRSLSSARRTRLRRREILPGPEAARRYQQCGSATPALRRRTPARCRRRADSARHGPEWRSGESRSMSEPAARQRRRDV